MGHLRLVGMRRNDMPILIIGGVVFLACLLIMLMWKL